MPPRKAAGASCRNRISVDLRGSKDTWEAWCESVSMTPSEALRELVGRLKPGQWPRPSRSARARLPHRDRAALVDARPKVPLTEEEWRVIRLHPQVGADIAGRIPRLRPISPLIRSHHERYDGTGYPDRLSGNLTCLLHPRPQGHSARALEAGVCLHRAGRERHGRQDGPLQLANGHGVHL